MKQPSLQRHYPIRGLNFRDFWDVVSHYQHVNPRFGFVTYTVEGMRSVIVQDETDVAMVLRNISSSQQQIRRYTARLFDDNDEGDNPYGNVKFVYLPALSDFQDAGLYYYGVKENKLALYKFEDLLYNNYALDDLSDLEPEYGLPCEVLACVVDMRGFSAFCEQPQIESPYTCGLMTSFYHTVKAGFLKYPADMLKLLGDGVLAVWQTSNEDRDIAIDVCVSGLQGMEARWKKVLGGPHFIHGAPEGIGSAVCFGLASKISTSDDFLGRPINIASRLSQVCAPGQILIDRNVPGAKDRLPVTDKIAQLKTFGDYRVWAFGS